MIFEVITHRIKKGDLLMRLIATPLTMNDIERFAEAGADALVFGTAFFSVRAAAYMEIAQYKEIKERCERAQVEMLVLVNRFFVEQELEQLYEHLQFLKELDVDGIYVTDEAALAYALELGMIDRLVYQPDTLLTNHKDVNYYLNEGLQRVVLSKEITVEEIKEIARFSNANQIELIGHGRVVMMHSKRPLVSHYMSFIGKAYEVKQKHSLIIEEETRKDRMPILEDEQGTHVFSSYVQCSFDELSEFMNSGIGAMRIDGIFQTSAYIEMVIRLYADLRNHTMSADAAKAQLLAQYPEDPLNQGFYYRRTSRTK